MARSEGVVGADWPKLIAPPNHVRVWGQHSSLIDIDNAMRQTMRYPFLRGAQLPLSSTHLWHSYQNCATWSLRLPHSLSLAWRCSCRCTHSPLLRSESSSQDIPLHAGTSPLVSTNSQSLLGTTVLLPGPRRALRSCRCSSSCLCYLLRALQLKRRTLSAQRKILSKIILELTSTAPTSRRRRHLCARAAQTSRILLVG